jgi:alkylhydroperoxidase/carboxymuconolactone decarboxylase family protein YurZ
VRAEIGPQAGDDTAPVAGELKARFEPPLGDWPEAWDDLLEIDSGLFEHVFDLYRKPWEEGPLDPKEKEVIMLAYSITATHLDAETSGILVRGPLDGGDTAGGHGHDTDGELLGVTLDHPECQHRRGG